MSYYLASSLSALRAEVNKRWPNRSKVSDGWIGDASHQARKSDHNPDWTAPGRRRGVVRALDITTEGVDVDLLLKHTTNDSRVAYVIYNRRIYQHSTGWQPYNGSNPHTNHVHVSIAHLNSAENDVKAWFGSASTTPASSKPAESAGTGSGGGEWPTAPLVVDGKFWLITKRGYQRLLAPAAVGNYRGIIDGEIGPLTVRAEQTWLKNLGYYKGIIDGQRGPLTIRALQGFLKAKGHYPGRIDGSFGPMSVRALQAYMNDQRKFY